MGTIQKAWLIIVGLIALVTVGLFVYLHQSGDKTMAKYIMDNGGTMVIIMVIGFGLMSVFKWMAEQD